MNPSSAWVGLSLCTTLTLFDGFVYSDYVFEFEVRSEDEYVEEVVVEEVVASANITVVLQEEVIETFVPVNKTVPTVETFDFEEAFTTVEYLFSTGEPITSPADIAILRNAFPYPVPYITEIDSKGGIKVVFSRTLSLREAFKNTSKRDRLAFIEQDLIETRSFFLTLMSTPKDSDGSSGEDSDQMLTTLGDVHFDEEKFAEGDQKRNLQEKTEEAGDTEQEQRSFNWTISDFDGESLIMQINYNDTLVKGQLHRIEIAYNDTYFLQGLESKLVMPAGLK